MSNIIIKKIGITKLDTEAIVNLGGGCAKAAKDIKDSLSWWGVSSIMIRKYKLMNSAGFDEISEKRHSKIEKDLKKTAEKIKSIDYSKPSHTNISAKIKFFIVKTIKVS